MKENVWNSVLKGILYLVTFGNNRSVHVLRGFGSVASEKIVFIYTGEEFDILQTSGYHYS